MARFWFSLGRLLQLRTQELQQAQSILQQLSARRRAVEAMLEQLHREREALQETATRSGTVPAQYFHDLWAYSQHLQQQLEEHHRECSRLRQMETAQQAQLREVLKAKDVLERLRERRWEAFRRAEDRQEQRLLDEIAQRQHRQP